MIACKSVFYILNIVSAIVLSYILSTVLYKILIYILTFLSAFVLNCISTINGLLQFDLYFTFCFPFRTKFFSCLNLIIATVVGDLERDYRNVLCPQEKQEKPGMDDDPPVFFWEAYYHLKKLTANLLCRVRKSVTPGSRSAASTFEHSYFEIHSVV